MNFEIFNKALEELGKEKRSKYEFVIRGGKSLKKAIFHLFRTVWEREEIPESWNKTTLLQLGKGKGHPRVQKNTRFIHLKEQIPKVFSYMIVNQVKDTVMKNMTPF